MDWKKALDKKGFGLGSTLELMTSDGRKVRFKANRKQIKLSLKKGVFSEFKPGHIILPGLRLEGEFQFIWDETSESYLIESIDSSPFVINRVLCHKSHLMEGDELYFDYNQVRMAEKHEGQCTRELLPYRWPEKIPFLIEGETGTGKTSLAKKLHHQFVGNANPFVALNLSALNPALIESELFGHEKGAFTGAIRDKRGAVELAKNGTLFLDEIDSLEKPMQVKLLTFLDDLKYRRVGGERELETNCRIIFASGRNLNELVKRGDFRADLLYRIQSGVVEKLSPLRLQPEVIRKELLKFSEESNLLLEAKLANFYEKCSWPGNFRQLHSHLKRKEMQHFGSRTMSLCLLDQELEQVSESSVISLEAVKSQHCKKIYLESRGSISLAAERLQISRNTLRRMVS